MAQKIGLNTSKSEPKMSGSIINVYRRKKQQKIDVKKKWFTSKSCKNLIKEHDNHNEEK